MSQQRAQNEPNRQTAISRLGREIARADAIVIGAGAGLSTAAGFTYSGPRFDRYFADFAEKYHYQDMYSGGFYPYEAPEIFWAFWSRNIWVNRYMDPPRSVYKDLLRLVREKDYFVLTTNVDHCFQKAGFDKKRLFYTQGDYGLFQCSEPCCQRTWDNEGYVRNMLLSQGFNIGPGNELTLPEGRAAALRVPHELVPKCPNCGKPLTLNLRSDDKFIEDAGWREAAQRYSDFMNAHDGGHVLYLELGVGYNTPGIIKYNFWQRVFQNPEAVYACLNYDEAEAPREIAARSIGITGDSAAVLEELLAQ